MSSAAQLRVTTRLRRRRLILATLALAAFGAVNLAIWYGPPVVRALDARARAASTVDRVAALQIADLDRRTVSALRDRVRALRTDLAWLSEFIARDPLLGIGRHLGIGRDLETHAALLAAAGEDLYGAASIALDLADRFVVLREREGAAGELLLRGLVELVATSTAEVDAAAALFQSARDRLASLPANAQSDIAEAAAVMRAAIDRFTPLLDQAREVDDVLPGIVGWGAPKRYLVLAQDPAELRPTGGYVGTVGLVRFDGGVLAERVFQDVFEFDLRPGLPFVEPPRPLAEHLLGIASWHLADANWSPHFPTAAQDALRLYSLESGDTDIDGVIAITTHAVDRLLEVTGPVAVPQHGVTVSPGEVTLTALRLTRGVSTPDNDRKAFLDDLASAVIERLYALPPESWPALFDAFRELGDERMLLTWFRDPAAQALVAESPMGGAVRDDAGDYLYVVEANVAPTSKYNLVVQRSDRLSVALSAAGDASSSVAMTWTNDALRDGEPYASIRSYSTNKNGLYATYVRVLTPLSSALAAASGTGLVPVDAAEVVATDSGRATFENYMIVEPTGATLSYSWSARGVATLSDGVWTYALTIQRQPGMRPVPLSVAITLPAGAQPESASPGIEIAGGTLSLNTTLERDVHVQVRYRLP